MANTNPKTDHLVQFAAKWFKVGGKSRKTKLVRIPEDIFEEVMAFAHELDAKKHGQQN